MLGETIDGRYEIIRFIGEGGMGSVYEARHVATRRRVALKMITGEARADPERLARFQVEAKAAGRLDSDHITQVLDFGQDAERDCPYMAIEYLEGEDLAALFERRGRLPVELALRIVCQALYGLSKAHEAGVTHRDIKPANIFLAKRDKGRRVVKVLDFGIAKIRSLDANATNSSSGITIAGKLIGSPLYMSPEQTITFKGLDPRTDVWSMGIVLFEALVGRTPFADAETLADLIILINTEPVRMQERAPWVPSEVARVVETALTAGGKDRYADAQAMLAALEPLLPHGSEINESLLEQEADDLEDTLTARPELPSLMDTDTMDGGAADTDAVATDTMDVPTTIRLPELLVAEDELPTLADELSVLELEDALPTRVRASPSADSPAAPPPRAAERADDAEPDDDEVEAEVVTAGAAARSTARSTRVPLAIAGLVVAATAGAYLFDRGDETHTSETAPIATTLTAPEPAQAAASVMPEPAPTQSAETQASAGPIASAAASASSAASPSAAPAASAAAPNPPGSVTGPMPTAPWPSPAPPPPPLATATSAATPLPPPPPDAAPTAPATTDASPPAPLVEELYGDGP
jgi:eukaryotic-like serine/threonine-protein kinase